MKKTPIFHEPRRKKKKKPPTCMRNFHCQHYEACMGEAAMKDLLLDCGACEYKLDGSSET